MAIEGVMEKDLPAETPELVYWKLNVRHFVAVRKFYGDNQGVVLTPDNPYFFVENKARTIKDFKRANESAIRDGKIIQLDYEPSTDFEGENTISDEKALELVKNPILLKKALKGIDSESTIGKLLAVATESDRTTKTINLIKTRQNEILGIEEDEEETPPTPGGVYN